MEPKFEIRCTLPHELLAQHCKIYLRLALGKLYPIQCFFALLLLGTLYFMLDIEMFGLYAAVVVMSALTVFFTPQILGAVRMQTYKSLEGRELTLRFDENALHLEAADNTPLSIPYRNILSLVETGDALHILAHTQKLCAAIIPAGDPALYALRSFLEEKTGKTAIVR